MPGIITQQGDPVSETPEPEEEEVIDLLDGVAKEINEGIKGFRKFRNGIILKVGVIAVALKVVSVAGQIIIENQRLKATLKDRQQREQDDE